VGGSTLKTAIGLGAVFGPVLGLVACGSPSHPPELGLSYNPSGGTDAGAYNQNNGTDAVDGGVRGSGTGTTFGPAVEPTDDPQTCEQAAMWGSYVGCEYWPTVTANNVWSIFDFAVVVANAGNQDATVTVTGPGSVRQTQFVAPNELVKFYLPWVPALKGPDADSCGTAAPFTTSVFASGGAYHLVSSVPVTVFQFNALEYRGSGGPQGKSWSQCPGNATCLDPSSPSFHKTIGCYSFSNDSSLLLPTTALTGNYRVTAFPGESASDGRTTVPMMASYIAITGTANGTHVKIYLSSTADVRASAPGGGIAATGASRELDLTLNAGDVAELTTDLGSGFDISGSLVHADQPVQVIAGAPCDEVPSTAPACDHLEQSVFPAETLGKRYFVTVPSAPAGGTAGHVVRLYGNVDNTELGYSPSAPAGCPKALNAGEAADCGVVTSDFEVTGTHEFGVASFMLGGSIVDPSGGLGDPSQSVMASVEQYRTKYVFLAPNDYDVNYADVVLSDGTSLFLDGAPMNLGGRVTTIADGYGVWRVQLDGSRAGGAHLLESSAPVGLQVLGYGLFTSYQYPGGLNLNHIAPPPQLQ
jgi:hypothetical protein